MDKLSVYEIGFHFIPDLSERDVKKRAEKISSFISKEGGKILDEQKPALIDLEYEIRYGKSSPYKYFKNAFFGGFKYEMKTESVAKLDEFMKESDGILRFLIFKTVAENTRVEIDIEGDDSSSGKKRNGNNTNTNNNKVLETN